ncbi:alpha/beta fold hydrolase [Chitinophaga sp. G-6-1-13]|uniref:Alpha/beta fold hydrolase n=1 Tax=Chitinophaga fulva TaxID=2728842 RepID=A0A848GTA9_9BACT|nr:alpha/beta fold hydrolase [Chitinophaga fulva]NML40362.1 alpha/beta fold hydrolase [Chitinophaga fulva]
MALTAINGINLNISVKGEGHPVILIHGVGGESKHLSALIDRLSSHFKTIALDCRGHGLSDKPAQYTLQDHINDIIGVMDYFELPVATLLGVSMGSYIAQGVAIAAGERIDKLVLTVPKSNGLTSSVHRLMHEHASELEGLNLHEIFAHLLRYFTYDAEAMKAHMEIFDTELPPEQFAAANKALAGFDFRGDLGKITAETLVISGKYDGLNPPEEGRECAKLIPHAAFVEMQYSGHAPMYEEPEVYMKAVETFLLMGRPKFHTTVLHYAINLVNHFLGLHNIDIGRLKVRTALYEKAAFPETSIQDISMELQEWGIRHELKTVPCSIADATTFPTLAIVRMREEELLAIIEKVEGDQIYLNYYSTDTVPFSASELTVLQYLDIKEIIVDKAFCEACRQEDLSRQEAYADTVFAVEDFMSEEECNYMIDYCERHDLFNRSTIGAADGTYAVTAYRTSYSAFITTSKQDPVFNAIIERAANLMEVDAARIENLQCVRYGEGQEYKPHFDSSGKGMKRKATLLVYLNDNFEGGGTVFPEIGLSVYPKKGMALSFTNLDEQNNDLIYSLHGGAPVTAGTKFACNIWVHP